MGRMIAVPASSIFDGAKAVTTAGTEVCLVATSTPCLAVTIQALRANTGIIYVGGTTIAANRGISLSAGESWSVAINDLIDIWIDASVSLDGVSFVYVT